MEQDFGKTSKRFIWTICQSFHISQWIYKKNIYPTKSLCVLWTLGSHILKSHRKNSSFPTNVQNPRLSDNLVSWTCSPSFGHLYLSDQQPHLFRTQMSAYRLVVNRCFRQVYNRDVWIFWIPNLFLFEANKKKDFFIGWTWNVSLIE